MKSQLGQAFDYLMSQIRNGFEYPDAHTNACEQFKLTPAQGKKLQKKYDSIA